MYSSSGIPSSCSSVGRRRPLTTTGSSLRPDDRVSRYSWAAARSLGLTLCTGRAADLGTGVAISGEGAGTTATVVLGLATDVLTPVARTPAGAALAATAPRGAGRSLGATAAGLAGFSLTGFEAALGVACRTVLGSGLLALRATALIVLPVFFAAALGRAGAFVLEAIWIQPLASQAGLEPLKNRFPGQFAAYENDRAGRSFVPAPGAPGLGGDHHVHPLQDLAPRRAADKKDAFIP